MEKQEQNKESPLYRIRTKNAIGDKIQEVKTKFLGDRLFFLQFRTVLQGNGLSLREQIGNKFSQFAGCTSITNVCGSCAVTRRCILNQ